ncbi:MAG: SRPBCC family protein [Thermoanaerobaculia bacterium]
MRAVLFVPLVLFVLLVLSSASAAPPAGERRETPTGDVWLQMVPSGKGRPKEGIGHGVIDAPPERVYRALVDYRHWEEFMPFLEKSDARPQPDGSVLSAQLLELPPPLGRRHYEIRARHRVEGGQGGKVWKIEWTCVAGSGNVAGHHGSWTLLPNGPGRTWATCRLYTDPGGGIPHWAVNRGTSETLPWIFHGLRQHVRRSRYGAP